MPNIHNIQSPITLISFGRSGTSLVSKLFDRHTRCHSVNETINLIFSCWQASELSYVTTPPLFENGQPLSMEVRSAKIVHQTLLTCFQNNADYWFHKPIGIPLALNGPYESNHWEEAATRYWHVMENCFPKGKFITILRNPLDVVISQKYYHALPEAVSWKRMAFMAYLITHKKSKIEFAIDFDKLNQDKEESLKQLFRYCNLEYQEDLLKVFNKVYAQNKKIDEVTWRDLNPKNLTFSYYQYISFLLKKFNYSWKLPEYFNVEKLSKASPADNVEPKSLGQTTLDYQMKLHMLHSEYKSIIRKLKFNSSH